MYEFTSEMGEISGFGGSYEQCCRDMLKIALEWHDKNPNAKPRFKGYEGIYGICFSDNKDAKSLEKAIIDSIEGCTGAMFQAVISTYFWVIQNGWDAYVREMSKKEAVK